MKISYKKYIYIAATSASSGSTSYKTKKQKMYIVLDTEKYYSPTSTNTILETFLHLKKEVLRSLETLKEKLDILNGVILIIIKPQEGIRIALLHFDDDMVKEINDLLNLDFDVSKIADDFQKANNN